jgi:hypothetical protein
MRSGAPLPREAPPTHPMERTTVDNATERTQSDASPDGDLWSLSPARLTVCLPGRIGRRFRTKARDRRQTPEHLAALILAAFAVPDAGERARLMFRDLHEAGLGNMVRRRR